MDKKILALTLYAVAAFVLMATAIGWVTTTIGYFDPTSGNASNPAGYFTMIIIFRIAALLLFAGMIVMSALMFFGNKDKGKLYAYIAAGAAVVLIILWIVARCAIPPAAGTVGVLPQTWDTNYSALFTPLRTMIINILIVGGILTVVPAMGVFCKGKKEKNVQPAKTTGK